MDIRLDGKIALVTGGSRGIGRGCALRLAQSGADVVVNYRGNKQAADDVVREIESMGRRALAVRADVSDREQVDRMVAAAESEFGQIDILVANAATSTRKPFLETDLETLRETIDVTMYGVFNSVQAVARSMVAKRVQGSIIVIGSIHGKYPLPLAVDYNMAKGAVHQLTMTAARELIPYRIRVNLLIPGWIDTPGERKWTPEEEIYEKAKGLPWNRLGTPDEVGRVAVFLASDLAEYVTGSIYSVDGGLEVSLPSGGSSKVRAGE